MSAAFGDPLLPSSFWRRVVPNVANGCWEWTGATNGDGYGFLVVAKRQKKAHRVAFEVLIGAIPDGLQIDHLCRVRNCVNPDHLEPVSLTENVRRGDVGARLRQLTECKKGHEFTPENTIVRPDGSRNCRECKRAWSRSHDHRPRKGSVA